MAGVYLNEDVIIPLCDEWASIFRQLKEARDKNYEEYSKLLAHAQDILSKNYTASELGISAKTQVEAEQLKDLSHLSDTER